MSHSVSEPRTRTPLEALPPGRGYLGRPSAEGSAMRWAALAGMTTIALGLWVRLRRMQAERDQLRLDRKWCLEVIEGGLEMLIEDEPLDVPAVLI